MHGSTHPAHRKARFGWLLTIACTLGLAAPCAMAQQAIPQPHLSAQQQADRAAIQNFPLDMAVVKRLAATIEAGNREHMPCMNDNNPASMRSIDAMAHELATRNPRALPLLASHGFTPRQFITAMLALANTGMAAEMMSHPGSPFAQAIEKRHQYNARNVAFYNAHRAEITAMTRKMQNGSSCGN